jgi:signal peptidase I
MKLIGIFIFGIILQISLLSQEKISLKIDAVMENTIPFWSVVSFKKENFKPFRFEIIGYKNPDFDTVTIPYSHLGYYHAIRSMGKEAVNSYFKKKYVSFNERDVFIGRCVALPGDTLLINNADLFINSKLFESNGTKRLYILKYISPIAIKKLLAKLEYTEFDLTVNPNEMKYELYSTKSQLKKLLMEIKLDTIYCNIDPKGKYDKTIFPYDVSLAWNKDNFGTLIIPRKGVPIKLSLDNLTLYNRLISVFENNKLIIKENSILINGKKCDSYTPKKNYYFIINDNRHNSFDSRNWGFLPDDHIVARMLDTFD